MRRRTLADYGFPCFVKSPLGSCISCKMPRTEDSNSRLKEEGKHSIGESQRIAFPWKAVATLTTPTESNPYSDVCEITIPIGPMHIRMLAPRAAEDPSSRITFWWGITSAAIALARHVQSMDGKLLRKRVIELGCGLGLAGITAGLMGANVLFTDYVREALDFARKNAALNGLPAENARFSIVDWEHAEGIETADLVLGSEIVYDYFFHSSLIDVVRRTVARDGVLLLADRKRLCVSRFIGRLTRVDFACSETVHRVKVPGFPPQDISLFEVRRS